MCVHMCTYVDEWNIHRSVYIYARVAHIHIHRHTEDPAVLPAEAPFLWDEDDRVQGPPESALFPRGSPGSPAARPSHLHLLGLRPLAQALQQVLPGHVAVGPQEPQAQGRLRRRLVP